MHFTRKKVLEVTQVTNPLYLALTRHRTGRSDTLTLACNCSLKAASVKVVAQSVTLMGNDACLEGLKCG